MLVGVSSRGGEEARPLCRNICGVFRGDISTFDDDIVPISRGWEVQEGHTSFFVINNSKINTCINMF